MEREVLESIKRGSPIRNGLKAIMLFYFFNMKLGKVKTYLKIYTKHFGENDRDIRWLQFMLDFLAMKPLKKPESPLESFYYHLYYRGDTRTALEILEENKELIRKEFSPELMHSMYVQVLTVMGRMYVIPEGILKRLRGPMEVYLGINRGVGGDVISAVKIFKPGRFRFVLFHPFSKRLAIVGRMMTALMEGDSLTYEVMLNNFNSDGERYLYTIGRILGSLFDPSLGVTEEEIPEYVRFLRIVNAHVLDETCDCRCPEGLMGLSSFLWHMRKVRNREIYVSFGGKVRLLKGLEEIHLPRRKALIVLAIMRSVGMEGLRAMAPQIFPGSPRPLKTIYDYMRFIKRYRFAPSNLRYTLHSGTFLYDETEPWAMALKDMMRRSGKLNPPVLARP